MKTPLKIALASSEVAPFAKTGGLADVSGALPKYLTRLGCDVKVFMPKYVSVDDSKWDLHYCADIGEILIRMGRVTRSAHVLKSVIPGSEAEIYFIECPHYYHRRHIYTMDRDEDERFILFCKAVIEVMQRIQWAPDVVHCNDWQTGLIPIYLKDNYNWDRMFDRTACLYSIHNIAYQGRFSKDTLYRAEMRPDQFYPGGPMEFHDTFSFMKTGILSSEIVTTVSHTYAKEILTYEYGNGMNDVLWPRQNDLFGVLNGIDYDEWNPEKDKYIPHPFSQSDLSGKEKNKKFLLEQTHLTYDPAKPVIGIVSRLVGQKGFDLIEKALPELMLLDAQWVILGSGEDRYEDMFENLHHALPYKVWTYIGYSNELAHRIEAGADIFLMPSHFEPCGLNQMYSQRYGTIPVVRKTGGLADTVWDWHELHSAGRGIGNGFTFTDASPYALFTTLLRALETYKDKTVWRKIQQNAMAMDHSWDASAQRYIELYKMAIQKRRAE
ncbi:MAG TPA: glycogen synthase GlgA [bacterium]|nr:glycogen synthase GlgA [bacterium]HMW32942.1 glycogen synthase GlgA [bacterium]HMW36626.1 glycogen synthase GlgA [bacterium]HNB09982.1 glycogen synthase GlgA [bacterium]HNB56720.1 glycogen synthase GlgA [bacterium]